MAGGQHTRLFSRALVLERDGRKVALVQIDLFMVPGGMVQHIGEALAARGFSERNILISASHTHSGPGGYANFPTLNTAAPSLQTATDPLSFFRLLNPDPADRQLYTFLVRQIATAIRARGRRPRRRRGRLGLVAHPGADAQPQPRGPPGQPRQGSSSTARARRPTTRAATSTRSTRP